MMAALASCTASSDSLQHDLEAYTATCDAEIGVAVITDRSDTICVNNDRPYPMNSVVKLYQAMAVAATLEQRGTPLDTVITIARDELHPTTYSPIRDNCPGDTLRLTVARLLEYSLQLSDNNAFDILADRVVDLPSTRRHIDSLGIRDFDIRVTECDMAGDHHLTEKNWNSPLAAAELIHTLFTRQLYADSYQDFLKNTLTACDTGSRPAGIPPEGNRSNHRPQDRHRLHRHRRHSQRHQRRRLRHPARRPQLLHRRIRAYLPGRPPRHRAHDRRHLRHHPPPHPGPTIKGSAGPIGMKHSRRQAHTHRSRVPPH